MRAGKSLLPAGVTEVRGTFEKGDCVCIVTQGGVEIARGLARYDAADAARIKGLKSAAIADMLDYDGGSALVHADDIAQM